MPPFVDVAVHPDFQETTIFDPIILEVRLRFSSLNYPCSCARPPPRGPGDRGSPPPAAVTCCVSSPATCSAWVEIMKWAAPPSVTAEALVHRASSWLLRRTAGWLSSPHSTSGGMSILATAARVSRKPYPLLQSSMLVAVVSIA